MTTLGLAALLAAGVFHGAFTFEDDGAALTLKEENLPVFVYRYAPVEPPRLVPKHFKRSCYFHPLYGLDGEIMTQDFPIDHFHHRGVFWAWPDSTLGDRKVDVWALEGARQVHGEWTKREAGADRAELAMVNQWMLDDAPNSPVIREEISVIVYPALDGHRCLDFSLTFKNVSSEAFTLRGSGTETKGYGGFCLRPDATRKPMLFTSNQGVSPDDVLELDTPWADVSYPTVAGGDTLSGMAIFQHPDNPGYPHSGWIFRHYGFLGQSWPHTKEHVMQPQESFTLRYRLFLHRGDAEKAGVKAAFEQYLSDCHPK